MRIETPPSEKPYDKAEGERRGKAVKIYQFMKVLSARLGHRDRDDAGQTRLQSRHPGATGHRRPMDLLALLRIETPVLAGALLKPMLSWRLLHAEVQAVAALDATLRHMNLETLR